MAADDIEALYRAAIAAHLDLPEQTPCVRDAARAVRKLAPLLRDVAPVGRRRIELTFEDGVLRKIEPCVLGARVWAELD